MAGLAVSVSRRHPWLDSLVAAPQEQVRALIGGYADIPPFQRAEPADAAVSLLFGLDKDDAARQAFDRGCLELLQTLRGDLLAAESDMRRLRLIAQIDSLLAVIRRTVPRETVLNLHRRYPYWFGVFETAIVDRSLDLRREFWRVLALTQAVVAEDREPRRLLPLWLDMSAQAGPNGNLDDTYFDVARAGVRNLPLGAEHSSNEEAACHALARWAARQRPDKQSFLARWREVESLYPRSPDHWPELVAPVIAATEHALSSFPAADWWREDLELPKGSADTLHGQGREFDLPDRQTREDILRDIGHPLTALRPRIDALVQAHRRYADATGDVYYAVRTACNVGMRLLEAGDRSERAARGAMAVRLARIALEYQSSHVYAWALWRDGLATQGALDAAELVGWEAVRRFPEDPQRRTQLALLLADRRGRTDEAERLLRETMALFPDNAVARTQLADVLSARGDFEAARSILAATVAEIPSDAHAYAELAILLADSLQKTKEAIAVLEAGLAVAPDNEVFQGLLKKARAGKRLRAKSAPDRRSEPDGGVTVGLDFDVRAAQARRALFRAETGDDAMRQGALAEVRRILDDDPGLAYVRYVAERTGLKSFGRLDTAMAFAFERARRGGALAEWEVRDGVGRQLAAVGVILLRGGSSEFPEPANEGDEGSLGKRLDALVRALGRRGDRQAQLRLLSDFAAAELSLGLAA